MAPPDRNPVLDPAAPPSAPHKAQKRVACRCHCECGRHFASLDAFDLHRPGRTGQRKCVDPSTVRDDKGKPRLAEKGTDAVCALTHHDKATGHPVDVHGVTVWQTVEAARWGLD